MGQGQQAKGQAGSTGRQARKQSSERLSRVSFGEQGQATRERANP